MLGADIIDLNDPLLRERNDRSFGLIRYPQDQPIPHPQLFWLLWTAKEAVFKANREIIAFSPTKISINLKDQEGGIIFHSGHLTGSFEISHDYILALVSSKKEDVTLKVYKEDTENWSVLIRQKLESHLEEMGVEHKIVSDKNGLPILSPGDIPISFSHHGKYGAFAYPTSFLDR